MLGMSATPLRMKPMRCSSPLAILALAAAPGLALAQGGSGAELPGCYEDFIEAKMIQANIPGIGAAVVRDGEVVWAGGFGQANIELALPATADTPFFLASISKTVTAVAVMQLRDLGLFELDDDVNDYLSFSVENPNHPGVPITFRQLLSHTASLQDNWDWMDPQYVSGDSPMALAQYLPQYLDPSGLIYHPAKSYYPWAPGTAYSYCNQGFALLGLLVEEIANQDFAEFAKQNILEPLGMNNSSFRLSDFDPNTIAMPYQSIFRGVLQYSPHGHFGYPDYPAGTLRASANDLARFMLAIQGNGTHAGTQILAESSVLEMKTVQYPQVEPTQGLCFYYSNHVGEVTIGHDGGDPGVLTDMYYQVDDEEQVGVLLLANSDAKFINYMKILNSLFQFAESFSIEQVRLGTPPNPDALRPGATSGPVVDATWDPVIDHSEFLPTAKLDFLFVSAAPTNIDLGAPLGTFLCDALTAPPIKLLSGAAGTPFQVGIPDNCLFIGLSLCAQGASTDGISTQLTNALDVVIGAY